MALWPILIKHSTLDLVIVSVVSSNPTGGNFFKFFNPLDVNFGSKYKCDLIVKNSIGCSQSSSRFQDDVSYFHEDNISLTIPNFGNEREHH